ncbi:SseB family protein [Paraoerskovia marina]|uniref:SseB family protein n=1 Tax=Paraoerskovia marina TaxID=545619 RepID=UPI0005BE1537|nr:SseB family protein [Paraoerskovia marina]
MTGRQMPPSSGFAGDDGSADPALAAALSAHAAADGSLSDVVSALADARLLVPVLAEAEVTEEGEHGTVDREASSGVVALETPDGRRALPVFSSVESMARWRKDARPVPVESARAAQSAVSEGWSVLVVDPAGPHTALLPRPAVWAIGQGKAWEPAVVDGVVQAEVAEAIVAAVGGIEHVAGVRAEPGRSAEVAVVLAIHAGLDRQGLDRVLGQVNAALARKSVIAERVDSLELRVGKAA